MWAAWQSAFPSRPQMISDPAPVILATPASSSVFPLGDTTVQVSASDNAGNRSTGNFPIKVLSPLVDGDGDGLNDSAEFLMSSLGYDWQVDQPALVNTLLNNANVARLFTEPQYAANRTNGQNDVVSDPNAFALYSLSQVQALHSGTPLIARDPGTGKFKLTMDWKKSTNLTDFLDFPAPPGSAVSISPQGDVEFEFPSTDNAAFYRIKME